MKLSQKRLEQYAELVCKVGGNVQEGQYVEIHIAPDQYELARALVDKCYDLGAKLVYLRYGDEVAAKTAMLKASEEALAEMQDWEIARLEWRAEELPVMIYIESSDPDGQKGTDPEKRMRIRRKQWPIIKPIREKMSSKYQWIIAAAASPEWAKKVYPDLAEEEAVEKLWTAIFNACGIPDENDDPVAVWAAKNKDFKHHFETLNSWDIDHMEYKNGAGTDFKVWLSNEIEWQGGGEPLHTTGVFFNPNLPTEEVFTTPIAGKAEGKLVASKPLSLNGTVVDNFWVEFEDGKVVRWDAEQGKDELTKLIELDEGSRMLGEIALVPYDSPINLSGTLFYNTLFDENASCHVALGAGFENLLKGFSEMTPDEWKAHGVNDSMTHVDFMIGTEDMNIDAVLKDGTRKEVFRDGHWAF